MGKLTLTAQDLLTAKETERAEIYQRAIDALPAAIRILNCEGKVYYQSHRASIVREADPARVNTQISHIYNDNGERIGSVEMIQENHGTLMDQIDLLQSPISIWEFDLSTRTLTALRRGSADYLATVLPNMPEEAMKRGLVHSDSVKELYRLFHRILAGDQKSAAAIHLLSFDGKDNGTWIRMSFTNIFDENGKPVRAIGIFEDASDEMSTKRTLDEEKHFREILEADMLMSATVNLTQDSFVRIDPTTLTCFQLPPNTTYSEYVLHFLERVDQDQVQALADMLNRDHLITRYYNGKQVLQTDYHAYYYRMKKRIWANLEIRMHRDSHTGDILCGMLHRNIDERKSKEEALQLKAEHDPLTGLYNRLALEQLTNRRLAQHKTTMTAALIMLDIDNFKKVNDQFGHTFGDFVLQFVSRKMRSIFRENDVLGRIGGDEFAVFLDDMPSTERLVAKGEELRQLMSSDITDNGKSMHLSVSLGIAFAPRDGMDFQTLYHHADEAAYVAKKTGKDRLEVYDGRNS